MEFNAESVKDMLITCDKERLLSILYNLIENQKSLDRENFPILAKPPNLKNPSPP